jgi:hypothetical protein
LKIVLSRKGLGASSLMAQFLGTRCRCGALAVTHRKIRLYRSAGRLTGREAGLVLPRADKPPVEPLCVHHLLAFLEERLGKGIKSRFWDGRLAWPRNTSRCRRRPCRGTKTNGSQCTAPAMRGSEYCQAHDPGRTDLYGLQPWLHGKRCKAVALSTGLRCKRAVMNGYDVCASTEARLARHPRPSWPSPMIPPLPTPERPSGRSIKRKRSFVPILLPAD